MKRPTNKNRLMVYSSAGCFCLLALLLMPSSALSQSPRPTPVPPPASSDGQTSDSDKSDHPGDFGSPESEMRAKLAIKEDKRKYEENLARAGEAAQIASQLRTSFETKSLFTSGDLKKLERLEKLARKIRSEAGGSETSPDVKDLPATKESAVKCLAEWTEDLHKEVEKTPRRVVSASVIDQANKLVGLIQYLRQGPVN